MTSEFAKAAKYFDVDDEMITATRIVLEAGGVDTDNENFSQ